MSLANPEFPSSYAFDLIKQSISASEENKAKFIKQANMVAQFDLKNKEGKTESWYLDIKNKGEVGKGKAPGKVDVTLIVSDADFATLVSGKANPQKLFMSGKLKVKGNVMKATNLDGVLKAARTEAKL